MRLICAEGDFADQVSRLAERAILADFFANPSQSGAGRLTAVFEAPPDPGWLVLSTELSVPSFRSVTPRLHAASWYEREIWEMHGLEPVGHPGLYRLRRQAEAQERRPSPAATHVHGPSEQARAMVRGQGVFQLPLGPVRSGPYEAGQFLFESGGEDIVMVSPRLGYKLRRVEELAVGQTPQQALILAERIAGTSTFANGLAFVQAAERALGIAVSGPARLARSLFNELERLHSHFADLSRVAEAAGLLVAAAQYGVIREEVLQACSGLAGHRYLRGILAVGGLADDVQPTALAELPLQLEAWSAKAARLAELLETTSTFIDRVETTGILPPDYASQHNLAGPVARASGADRDCRRDHPYAGYDHLAVTVPVKPEGDALARTRLRLEEVAEALNLVRQLSRDELPASSLGPAHAAPGCALGWAEAPGGQTLHHLTIDAQGRIATWRARPPAFVNWHPFADACASGNNLTDYPVLEASFAISHAEFDR
ncbi:MAG: NADH-quinone oxidoreductase subunit C [Candidatus Dormibacteria bacterium]